MAAGALSALAPVKALRPQRTRLISRSCLSSSSASRLSPRTNGAATADLVAAPEVSVPHIETPNIGMFYALDTPEDPKAFADPLLAKEAAGVDIIALDTSHIVEGQFASPSSNGAKPSDALSWNVPDSVWLTGAPQFWVDGHYGQSVVVGVIDSGIDRTHPCLAGRVVKHIDYTDEDIHPTEYDGHGTHVAGTIGALPASAEHNLAGVAPGVLFHDYRVFPTTGGASYSVIAAAVRQAVDDGCDIINMSLGGPGGTRGLRNAIKYARSKGVSVICAGGNEGSGSSWEAIIRHDEISYPAYYQETLAVACVDLDVKLGKMKYIHFSSTNRRIDVAADGYNLVSCWPDSKYLAISGTSMATPCVAGMAALLFSRIAERSGKDAAREINYHALLKAEAVDIFDDSGKRNNVAGYGLCTLLSEVPAYGEDGWYLRNLNTGSPTE